MKIEYEEIDGGVERGKITAYTLTPQTQEDQGFLSTLDEILSEYHRNNESCRVFVNAALRRVGDYHDLTVRVFEKA